MKKNPPTSVEFGAEISIEAGEGDSVPSFEIQAYKGGKLPVRGFNYPVVVELSSASFEKDVTKINRNHDQKRELGHAENQTITANGVALSGALSVPSKDRDEIVQASKAGFPWDASIEARFPQPQFIGRGQSISVNGKQQTGPFYFARNAVLTGVAILNHGADRNTVVTIAAELNGVESMTPELNSFIEAQGFDPSAFVGNDRQISFFQAQLDASNQEPNPETDPDPLATMRLQAAGEAQRLADINSICAQYGNPTIDVGHGDDKKTVSLAAHAIGSPLMTAKEVELEAKLFDLGKKSGGAGPAIHIVAEDSPGELQQTLTASLSMNHFGITEESAGKSFSDKVMNRALSAENRKQSLHSVMGQICAAAGMPYHGAYKSMDFWSHMVQAQKRLEASGTSTLSLPNMFENVLNKVQLDSFNLVPQMWREIAYPESVSDFKKTSRIRLTADGGYRKIGKDGELDHISVTDSKRSNQAETFGAIMSLTRVDIINDDMGALRRIAAMLGMMAGQKIEEEVWKTLLGNAGSFFSVGNKNVATQTLDIPGLSAVRDVFMNRVDKNKKPISVGPALLVAGIPLTDAASDLYTKGEYAVGNTASGNKLESTKNNHVGKYTPVISPYVSNKDIRDSDGKAIANQADNLWFLMTQATPMLHAINIVFLNGNQTPTSSTSDMAFNTLGLQYRSYHDFGVEYGDEEAAVKVN